MPKRDLISELQAAAEAEATRIVEDARREAEGIDKQAARDIADRRARFLAKREAELRREARSAAASARREATRNILNSRAELVERVFAAAEGLLRSASESPSYRSSLQAGLREALRYIDEDVVIRCSASLTPVVRSALGQDTEIDVQTDPHIVAGVIIQSRDGSMLIDDRLEVRLHRMAPALAIDVVAQLRER